MVFIRDAWQGPLTPLFYRNSSTIEGNDPERFSGIQAENQRQEDHIELIASENYTSPAVMEAQGSRLTNKYAQPRDQANLARVRAEVKSLVRRFPVYDRPSN